MANQNLNFCPNLSFMFTEHKTFAERYGAAAELGFKGVEICFPYDEPLEDVQSGAVLSTILINSHPGNPGQFGHAAIPGREQDFADSFEQSLAYAVALKVKRLHIMSGIWDGVTERNEGYKTLEQNLRNVLPALEANNIVGVIEPINNQTLPGYFLNNCNEALELIKNINNPFLRLQLDIFHLQQIQGNLTKFIRQAMPFVGHIQIAQVPLRNEPYSPGEIDYRYIFELLRDEVQYKDWIGLEYKPLDGTVKGLSWINNYGFNI